MFLEVIVVLWYVVIIELWYFFFEVGCCCSVCLIFRGCRGGCGVGLWELFFFRVWGEGRKEVREVGCEFF